LFPDGKSNSRQLYSVDCSSDALEATKMIDMSSQTANLSPEEALRRERMRLFADGIVSYEWNGTSTADQKVTVPFNGQVIQFDPELARTGEFRVVYDAAAGSCIDPHMAPDNSAVAFVMKDNLWVQRAGADASGPLRLTENGLKAGIQCGGADYIAQEEMSRYRGFWWSPDSKFIAYTETDENAVPEYTILHQGKDDPKHSESHRYPFAGETNPFVKLAVLAVPQGGATATPEYVWMNIADDASGGGIDPQDYYLGRVGWWSDGSVMAQVQNRAQSVLQLLRLDPLTGARTILLTEERDLWVNLYDMLYEEFPANWTPDGSPKAVGDFYFLWASERSGFSQIYLYHYIAAQGRCKCLLDGKPIGGGGEWVVENINAVDSVGRYLYFSGNRGNPTEKHLFKASFASAEATSSIQKLTKQAGTHNVAVSVQLGLFADIYSSLSALPTLCLYSLPVGADAQSAAGELKKELLGRDRSHAFPPERLVALVPHIVPPTVEVIRSHDNKVDLYCAVYRPDPAQHGQGPFPCIVSVYGGPHVMRVIDAWATSADLRAQRLAKEGYVVLRCDNRGTYRRGLAFEGALHRDMGNIEIKDQQAAVEHFVQQGLVDAARVGMFGWSYGGYMSAMAVCRAPETFRCGVAGAPVTSWDGYDTHYTERYMGTPANNPEGYKNSSVMNYVSQMTGRLLLVHGLIDENVHFRHTARLINELIRQRKRYDLVLFPCERHSPHKLQDRIYLEDRMLDFIRENVPQNAAAAEEAVAPLVLSAKLPSPKHSSSSANAAGGSSLSPPRSAL
jgi:dipeptidyl-peptidase-4